MRPLSFVRLPSAAIALLFAVAALAWSTARAAEPEATHETRDVLGWTLHVNKALVAAAPAMARAIEFTNIRIFPQECERMPNFALHELAHAYHFRVLGFDDPAIKEAFERARAAGLYDKVEQHHGNGRPNSVGRAYAMSDEKEYFAETSEAYFSRNDFFPFTRTELEAHDPRMLQVIETAWGVGGG